jgi:septal ring factor EnvC (AmiA/AmiB activator)
MLRRARKSATALDQTKDELARQESELRQKMAELEQMIADAPRVAEEITRQQREALMTRASDGGRRLDVSIALNDKRYIETAGASRRRPSLRKQRREGRIIFILLLITLMGAVAWLMTHLKF